MRRPAHPRCSAFTPACSILPGALGDLIASALEIDAGMWISAAAGPRRRPDRPAPNVERGLCDAARERLPEM